MERPGDSGLRGDDALPEPQTVHNTGFSPEFERRLQRRVASGYNTHVKRLMGTVIAVPLLVLLSPVLLVVTVAVLFDSGRPVLYRAERGGFGGRSFYIYKFRTMVQDADRIGGGTTALNDPRITRVGGFLRKTKLDEFPQLFNILRGEMCFIGPRPELLRYTEQYDGLEKYILQVRPGITDFSSIEYIHLDEVVGSDGADAAYERDVLWRKNQLRVKYVSEMSPLTDIRLFAVTVAHAFQGVVRQVADGRR
mgnify:FL=1